jgi:hypothetical protein
MIIILNKKTLIIVFLLNKILKIKIKVQFFKRNRSNKNKIIKCKKNKNNKILVEIKLIQQEKIKNKYFQIKK